MKNIYDVLEEIGIEYKKYGHPPVFTVGDVDKYNLGEGIHSKNLFLRNDKGDKHYLVVLEAVKRINLKDLRSKLKESNLSFASPERLMKYLKLTPGAVSPFGLINDVDQKVDVIVDQDLLKADKQGFHPNVNTATLVISTSDFKKFLDWTKNRVIYIKI